MAILVVSVIGKMQSEIANLRTRLSGTVLFYTYYYYSKMAS